VLLVEELVVEDVETEVVLCDEEEVSHAVSVHVSEVEQVVSLRRDLVSLHQAVSVQALQ
jgi:hypothetical protein